MKRVLSFLAVAGLVLAWCGSGFAAEQQKTMRAIGGIRGPLSGDRSLLVSGSAEVITGVSIASGSSAAVCSIYDSSSVDGTAVADGKGGEWSAPANEGRYYDLSSHPIRMKNGIVLVTDGDEAGVVIFTEQATP